MRQPAAPLKINPRSSFPSRPAGGIHLTWVPALRQAQGRLFAGTTRIFISSGGPAAREKGTASRPPTSPVIIDGLGCLPNPLITTGETGRGARPWPLRPIPFHPEGAACRGEAAPRPYFLVAYPHAIEGLGCVIPQSRSRNWTGGQRHECLRLTHAANGWMGLESRVAPGPAQLESCGKSKRMGLRVGSSAS
jgi:hypothetical protein